ncbi:hypothetical protein Avbf_12189 [Armadillidium vulgare]|nr:hypothetical protein Avbf_12189 [Armadillidium vulgare]
MVQKPLDVVLSDCLGINYRKKRMIRLKNCNRIDRVFESEKKLLILLNEVAGFGVDANLLDEMSCENFPFKRNGKEKLKKDGDIARGSVAKGVMKKVEKDGNGN